VTKIDLTAGRELFEQSTDFTVGLEEEFAILDPQTLAMTPKFEQLKADADSVLLPSIAGELIASEIEIRSGRGDDFADAAVKQREHRERLFKLAQKHGVKLGSTATHPWADYREQQIIDTDHYHRVEDGLKYVAWRNNTFSVHVHVGINGADRAIKVCDRLRAVLPELLAISANSPFLEGRVAGLHSVRSQIFTKSFPRCGVPDSFGDWKTFAAFIDFLLKTESVVEYTQVWWSVRPHLTFGTVEVRICDAQPTAAEAEALSALITACVAQAAREVDEGRTPAELPGRMIEENMWRAIRYGLDGELLDLYSGEVYPARAALDRLLAWTEEVRCELNLDPVFPERNGAQRQRDLIEQGMTLQEAYALTVQITEETYAHTPAEVKR
jgi:glutamate---cysteine ligase / carboxylate-amine ligase